MSVPTLRHRPIFGGVFGRGRYSLATQPCISRGLHAVRYMVIDPIAGAVLSVAEDKLSALASARRVLRAATTLPHARQPHQGVLWSTNEWPAAAPRQPKPKAVSRRRKEVFAKSEGRCHYCAVALTLDGPWHVEHMLPKALDGSDEMTNLVAACVPCNMAKGDATAIEFLTRKSSRTDTSVEAIAAMPELSLPGSADHNPIDGGDHG